MAVWMKSIFSWPKQRQIVILRINLSAHQDCYTKLCNWMSGMPLVNVLHTLLSTLCVFREAGLRGRLKRWIPDWARTSSNSRRRYCLPPDEILLPTLCFSKHFVKTGREEEMYFPLSCQTRGAHFRQIIGEFVSDTKSNGASLRMFKSCSGQNFFCKFPHCGIYNGREKRADATRTMPNVNVCVCVWQFCEICVCTTLKLAAVECCSNQRTSGEKKVIL